MAKYTVDANLYRLGYYHFKHIRGNASIYSDCNAKRRKYPCVYPHSLIWELWRKYPCVYRLSFVNWSNLWQRQNDRQFVRAIYVAYTYITLNITLYTSAIYILLPTLSENAKLYLWGLVSVIHTRLGQPLCIQGYNNSFSRIIINMSIIATDANDLICL